MHKIRDYIGPVLVVFLVVVIVTWIGLAFHYGTFLFWAPKMESAKRKVFEETKSYKQATQQDIARYFTEWAREDDPVAREAIVHTVRFQFAAFPPDEVHDPVLRAWFKDCLHGTVKEPAHYLGTAATRSGR